MSIDYDTVTLPTSQARDRLAEILFYVQDPRRICILTRYGRDVGAIISMEEVERIWNRHRTEQVARGISRPWLFHFRKGALWQTDAEAADTVQKLQLTRRIERETLARVGLEPLEGGELTEEVEVVAEVEVKGRRWWWFWR